MISPLTLMILTPLLGAFLILLIPKNYRFGIRLIALGCSLISMIFALVIFFRFDGATAGPGGFKFFQQIPWVSELGLSYCVGVDGINAGLILLSGVVAFAATAISWEIKERQKEFYLLLLIMSSGIHGAFASLDLFFFYFFHELALVPTFIMIGVWGRGEDKNYATFKITLYLSLGALMALVGLLMLYSQSGANTFNLIDLKAHLALNPIPADAQYRIFPWLLFGFGILISLWPFHTWAPLGYASAPTATTMLHAGVLKKFGLYGLLRVALPLLPEAAAGWMEILAWLCLGNILFCGWVAMRQRELNFLLGNSSVAHMGFAFLGIASLSIVGVSGAVFVMVAHGFLAALAFGLSGYIHQQTGTLQTEHLGGLLRRLPFIGTLLMMALMAGCGVPGFANFVGEVMVLLSAWDNFPVVTVLAVWGGLVVGGIYMFRAIRDLLHGPADTRWPEMLDASSLWRRLPYTLLLGALILFGFFPQLLMKKIQSSIKEVLPPAVALNLLTRPSVANLAPLPEELKVEALEINPLNAVSLSRP